MAKKQSIYQCDTRVKFELSTNTGMITAVSIRFDAVTYEVTFTDQNNEPKTVWMNEAEFSLIEKTPKTNIGFRP